MYFFFYVFSARAVAVRSFVSKNTRTRAFKTCRGARSPRIGVRQTFSVANYDVRCDRSAARPTSIIILKRIFTSRRDGIDGRFIFRLHRPTAIRIRLRRRTIRFYSPSSCTVFDHSRDCTRRRWRSRCYAPDGRSARRGSLRRRPKPSRSPEIGRKLIKRYLFARVQRGGLSLRCTRVRAICAEVCTARGRIVRTECFETDKKKKRKRTEKPPRICRPCETRRRRRSRNALYINIVFFFCSVDDGVPAE